MDVKPFNPRAGGTIVIANATSAAAAVPLHDLNDSFVFYNSSATAIGFIRVTKLDLSSDPAQTATTTADMPIPPGAQVRLNFGFGLKKISAIASAADGNLYVTAGTGN